MPATPSVINKLKTPLAMFYGWEQSRPDSLYMSQPLNGEWINYSWAAAGLEIRKLAAWLLAQGYEPGSKIALVSKNCAHWIMTDMAIQMAGMISVPIYPNVNAETVQYVLEHSESKMLFVGKLDQPNWDVMRHGVPKGFPCMTFPGYGQTGYPVWDEVLADVKPLAESPEGNLEDILSIIYTSGTTGTPKGVVLQTLSPVFAIHYAKEVFNFSNNERFFSYLPLSHIAERMLIEMGSLVTGGTIHLPNRSILLSTISTPAVPPFFWLCPASGPSSRWEFWPSCPQKGSTPCFPYPLSILLFAKKFDQTLA
ncbi:MAG: AMP-binding protein [Bacteroidia bacterium]